MSLSVTVEKSGCMVHRQKNEYAMQLLRGRQYRQANTALLALLKLPEVMGEQRAQLLASLLTSWRTDRLYDRDQYTLRLRELAACIRSFKLSTHSIFNHLRSTPCFFNCLRDIEYDLMTRGLH